MLYVPLFFRIQVMAYKDLQAFIDILEQSGELARVTVPVSPRLEMTEIADRLMKSGGKAVLFENTGTAFPVLMNAMGSEKRMCLALGVSHLEEITGRIDALFSELTTPRAGFLEKLKLIPSLKQMASWFPVHKKGRGECQEVVMDTADLMKLPILTCWPHDGGPFITFPVVHTRDPFTGMRNVGMYRMQVFDGVTTGMHWHLHKNSARHYHDYKRTGKRMPVTVTLGGDPAYTYSATAPLPDNVDEYLLAGFLRRKQVELVKCLTNELEVPADVDFVIEGYVDPAEDLRIEGPFGDHTGFYSLPDLYPVFHVTCITHRKKAVYPTTIVGIPPQEDLYLGLATERIFLSPIRMAMLPEIVDMHMPAEGVFHNLVLVKIAKTYPGQAHKVMNSLWGAGQMMFNKVMVVIDEDIKLNDYSALMECLVRNVNISRDVAFSRGPVDVLDHASAAYAFGGKFGIDGTRKLPEELAGSPCQDVGGRTFSDLIEIIPISKTEPGQVRKTAEKMIEGEAGNPKQVIVFVERFLEPSDYPSIVWRVFNNIDPARDCYLIRDTLVVDGTRKFAGIDNFKRPWPNCTVSDDETIDTVNKKWNQLGLGPLVESPSIKYRKQLYPGGAEAE